MSSEDGRLSAYDSFSASELSEPIAVFTEDDTNNLRHTINVRREMGDAPPKAATKAKGSKQEPRGPHRT